jgi:peptide/nickel transport system permease protein
VQGVVLTIAVGFVLVNLLVDVLYLLVNPRMRSSA